MSIDFTWLEENFFNQRLTDEEKDLLSKKMNILKLDADSIIVEQGRMVHALYIIHSGSAMIGCKIDGEDMHVGTVESGDFIGELSFLTAAEASATVTVTQACEIYELSRDSFTQLMRNHQDLVYAIFAHLLTHAADVVRQMNAEKAQILQQVSECPS